MWGFEDQAKSVAGNAKPLTVTGRSNTERGNELYQTLGEARITLNSGFDCNIQLNGNCTTGRISRPHLRMEIYLKALEDQLRYFQPACTSIVFLNPEIRAFVGQVTEERENVYV